LLVSLSLFLPNLKLYCLISYVLLTIILCVLSTVIVSPYITLAQKSEAQSVFGKISNQTKPDETLGNDSEILTSKYTPDQINDVIYRLYKDIQTTNNTKTGQNQDIAALMDLICSNELYDNLVEACDIVAELPIE
jgi:hypothetical protein